MSEQHTTTTATLPAEIRMTLLGLATARLVNLTRHAPATEMEKEEADDIAQATDWLLKAGKQ
ncbi:hypothetical protein [Larsenimonas rhizosphaerae]|uniref:hypothetical protein n=1 Tax=Larsenimonas rhizosphaerae TaxID=2944682 RepID=UPI002033AD61|nr:hypothetical protein [Larsenimonas rhizosphaerae]MCM2131432.1 hypothetical protein [Larsenimonas rhizosphaerae]